MPGPGVPAPFLDALRLLQPPLDAAGLQWAITGSLGFRLQGVPVEPRDLDLQFDAAGAYVAERLFAAWVVEAVRLVESERVRSHLGALELRGVRVELIGDLQRRQPDGTWDAPVPFGRHARVVEVAGLRLPVLDLAYEEQAYRAMGRRERADLLRAWLDSRPPG